MLYDENLSRFSPKQEWKCYGCIEMRLNSRCSNSKTSSNSTDTKSGIKCCVVCDHPPPVDVMSELLHQGRICVEISLCVVPDAFTTICVCSEFSRLLPRIFPEVCILAVAQRVVRYVMLKVLLYHMDCDVSRPTKYRVLEGAIQAHSAPLILEGEKMVWPQTLQPFCRSFFTFTHSICRVFHGTKSLFWTQMCPLNFTWVCCWWLLDCWFAGILEMAREGKPGPSWANNSMPTAKGGIEQKGIFDNSNVRRANSLELFLPWVVSQAECVMWCRGFAHAVCRKGYY